MGVDLSNHKFAYAKELKGNLSRVPRSGGTYLVVGRAIEVLLRPVEYFRTYRLRTTDIGQEQLLYVGYTETDLRHQLQRILSPRTSGCSLRVTLGAVLTDDLRLTWQPAERPDGVFFGAGEKRLNKWIDDRVVFCWRECDEAKDRAQRVRERAICPFNIDGQRHRSYARYLMRERFKFTRPKLIS